MRCDALCFCLKNVNFCISMQESSHHNIQFANYSEYRVASPFVDIFKFRHQAPRASIKLVIVVLLESSSINFVTRNTNLLLCAYVLYICCSYKKQLIHFVIGQVWGLNSNNSDDSRWLNKLGLIKYKGHINCLKWNKKGDFLLSGSVDKTTIV